MTDFLSRLSQGIFLLCAFSFTVLSQPVQAFQSGPVNYDDSVVNFRKTLSELVKADTTNPPGNEARAVAILGARLKEAGVEFQTMEFAPGRQNLVARLKGSGKKKPVLLLAHLDVVGTEFQQWATPPHEVTEKDGYLYGRGVRDDLGMAVQNLEAFLLIKKLGRPLDRDIILAFTGDEESGGKGIVALLEQHPDWIDAGVAINEGGSPANREKDSPVAYLNVEMAEKTYQDFTLRAKGETGHSSAPKKDNAIYKLAEALVRLAHDTPENRLIPVTRAYFEERAATEKPQVAKAMRAVAAQKKGPLPKKAVELLSRVPAVAAYFKTTCVATMLSGGTKANALASEASAVINCRILPDETIEQVKSHLKKVIADSSLELLVLKEFSASGASPLDNEMPKAIAELAHDFWPNAPLIPFMSNGATDARFLRARGIPSYGFAALAGTEEDGSRAHGIDERIQISSIRPAIEFSVKLLERLTGSGVEATVEATK